MIVLNVQQVKSIIHDVGFLPFLDQVIARLEYDYARWDQFEKCPRHAQYSTHGVIELMPICDTSFYAMKYVNGHPVNTQHGKLSVMGLGLLANMVDGAPLMFAEMTLLTAIRTACTSALVAHYAAREDASVLGFIGLGAQAEFQALALSRVREVKKIVGMDTDQQAVAKFKRNIAPYGISFEAKDTISAVVSEADILTTATAAKQHNTLFSYHDLKPGCHINAIGGDSPGKTELDINAFAKDCIIVQYLPQTKVEGEIQSAQTLDNVYELYTLIQQKNTLQLDQNQTTIFDSVGFAIEDYAILRVVYDLARKYMDTFFSPMIPEVRNPKDLFSFIQ
jgi:ornithine cyclodeaminase